MTTFEEHPKVNNGEDVQSANTPTSAAATNHPGLKDAGAGKAAAGELDSSADAAATGNAGTTDSVNTAAGELDSQQILEQTILYALDDAAERLMQAAEQLSTDDDPTASSNGFNPFVALVKDDEIFIEELEAESEEGFRAAAKRTIFQMARLSSAYVFCYDGFVELDDGVSDALITEFANLDDEQAQVIVRLYKLEDGKAVVGEELYHLGEAESLLDDTGAEQIDAGGAPTGAAPPDTKEAPESAGEAPASADATAASAENPSTGAERSSSNTNPGSDL